MRTLAVVPARGGSKRLPGKNLRRVGGKTLLEWTLTSAWEAQSIDQIIVSTDDPDIEKNACFFAACFARGVVNPASPLRKPLTVIRRPAEFATDTATILGVLQHALEAAGESPDLVVCLQPTTPFRPPTLIDDVVRAMGDADSAVTIHDGRPTGEVYVTRRHLLLAGRLLGGRCVDVERPRIINIDTEYDLVLAERT